MGQYCPDAVYAEASPDNLNGREGSKCTKTSDGISFCLAHLNAFSHSSVHLHGVYLHSSLFRGCRMEARLGMNLP